jgi:Flp pilus assembly protein TadD
MLAAAASLLLLGGCETSTKLGNLFGANKADETTGSVPDPAAPGALANGNPPGSGLLGSDPYDDLSLGKKHFRAGNYGVAEQHFQRAVELHSGDAEAWLGLAASYDRLRRFDLADRAYRQAIALVGPTPEVLNNQGYSYLLRGDYARARATLRTAQAKDPTSPYIQNNLDLLEKSARTRKGVE